MQIEIIFSIIINLLVAIYFGLFFGNVATSIYYRLPRNLQLLGFGSKTSLPPRCSVCQHLLKFKEYVPIFGYIMSKGKCNYCGVDINREYLFLEVFTVILSVFLCYNFIFLDWYIIFLSFGVAAALSFLFLQKKNTLSNKVFFFIIFVGLIYDTLFNQEIYNWLFKIAVILILYTLSQRKQRLNFLLNQYYENIKICIAGFIWFDHHLMIMYPLIVLLSFITVLVDNSFASKLPLNGRNKPPLKKLGMLVFSMSYMVIFFIVLINHLLPI